MPFPISLHRRLALLLAFGFAALAAWAGPASVIIRVPAGTVVPAELPALLAQWRHAGRVSHVLYLTEGRSEKPERAARFAALAVLEFPDEPGCAAWQRDAAAVLPAGLIARRADVLAQGGAVPPDSRGSAFIVNTYTPLVPPGRFGEFVQGYVRPLYEAMRGTGHLVRYTAYLERGETGNVDALNVLEYRDPAALAAMAKVKTAVRDQVAAATPTYAEFDKIKDSLRVDGYGTSAVCTDLPAVPAGK